MSIQLAPRVEALIREKVASGRYATAEEVVEAAMRLLDERDRGDRLRASLIEAEEQTRQGQVIEWTPELRDQIRREADAMTHFGVAPDPDVRP
jgi:putative addiction module CopG family antidote